MYACLFWGPARGGAAPDWDVVVYGSSAAGIGAATAAGQLGMRAVVYEPYKMIGGMGAAGNLNVAGKGLATGLVRDLQLLNGQYFNLTQPIRDPPASVTERSMYELLARANVTVRLDCHLLSATAARSDTVSRVGSIRVQCEPEPITASVFIDASYDGDLVVAVGDVDYTSGREAVSKYNESLAGARKPGFVHTHGPRHVDALNADGSILKYVGNLSDLRPPGEADDALMAFQHAYCITDDTDRVPWPKPDGYDPKDFLLYQRAVTACNGSVHCLGYGDVPASGPRFDPEKKKYAVGPGLSVSCADQPMLNRGWANASFERRQEIKAAYVYHELGAYYFLANDPSVPVSVRELYGKYGLCPDEFQQFNYIPPQLYVRSSNRLVGDRVLTQNNMDRPRNKTDSIAVATWPIDEHITGKYAVPVGGGRYEVQLEGNVQLLPCKKPCWYDVPYWALTPKRGTGANLLVPVCTSASSLARASLRIEGTFMHTGTAAGVAAKQLVDGSVSTVQDVDVGEVQRVLVSTFGQLIHGPPAPRLDPEEDTRII
jgi:hypothetical protein